MSDQIMNIEGLEKVCVEMAADDAYPVDLALPFNKAAKIVAVHWIVKPSTVDPGANQRISVGIAKLHEDSLPATPTAAVMLNNNVYCKFGWRSHIDTSGGSFNRLDYWCYEQFRCVLNPTILLEAGGSVGIYGEVYYDIISISQADFNRIAQWQGGYKRN